MKRSLCLLVSICVAAAFLGIAGALVLDWQKKNRMPPKDSEETLMPVGTPQEQTDLGKRIQDVGRRCLSLSTIAPIHYKETNINPAILALRKYHFFLVFGQGIAVSPCLVAVSIDGDVLRMPAEFENIIKKEGVVILSPTDARDLATTYVTLTIPLGKLLVLSSLEMIPGLDRNPPRKPLEVAISPPAVKKVGSDYAVQLFTWKEVGGVIEEWSITVSKNGTLKVQSEQLASHVGEAVGLQ